MKRYDLFCSYDGGGPAEPEERGNGDWVLYQDAAREIDRMSAEIQQLLLAEEGAKLAFGHVVDSKRALEREIADLRRNLHAAHDIIRRGALAQQEQR